MYSIFDLGNNTILLENKTCSNNKSDSEDKLPPSAIAEKYTGEMWLYNFRKLAKAVNSRKRYQNQDETSNKNELYPLKKVKIEDTSDNQFQEMWKYLQQDFSNFNEWVNLLHMVDNHNIEVNARMAFSKFLELYPLCYGYWKKYANFEKRNNNINEFEKILEDGLSAIPISVDLWIYYMTYLRMDRTNEVDHIRNEFERSLKMCGLDYRSDQLWHDYISWEMEQKNLCNAANIYYRLLRIPTLNYLKNFFKFQEFILKISPEKYLGLTEFLKRRSIIIKEHGINRNKESLTDDSIPPGEDFQKKPEIMEHIIVSTLRMEIIESWYYIHKQTAKEFGSRRVFEENISRTHFHVNELNSAQIKNWENYIKFERKAGNHERIIFLYERCLVTCVSIEGLWLNYLEYLFFVNLDVTVLLSDVFKRSLFHHSKSLQLNLKYFDFVESKGWVETAVETITKLEIIHPNSKEVAIRIINLGRRKEAGDLGNLFKHHLNCAHSKSFTSYIAVKYARFVWKHDRQLNLAFDIINDTITKNDIGVNDSLEIYLTFVKLKMELKPKDYLSVLKTIDEIIFQCNFYKEKLVFSKKKLEYIEDYLQDYEILRSAKIENRNLKNLCFKEKKQLLSNTAV